MLVAVGADPRPASRRPAGAAAPRRAAGRLPRRAARPRRPRPHRRRRRRPTSPPSSPTSPRRRSRPRWPSPAAELGAGRATLPARRHRDGQVRRPRAQLRQRRRRRSSSPSRATAPTEEPALRAATPLAVGADAGLLRPHRRGHASGRSTPRCARGQGRPAGAHPRQPPRRTTSAGPRPGSSRRCSRPARSPGDPELGEAYVAGVGAAGLAGRRARRLRRRRAGDAPPGRSSTIPAAEADRELKLGPGGLRDVEFAVQLLQLVHGRADPSAAQRQHPDALEALVDRRLRRPRRRRRAGRRAYRFLRTARAPAPAAPAAPHPPHARGRRRPAPAGPLARR